MAAFLPLLGTVATLKWRYGAINHRTFDSFATNDIKPSKLHKRNARDFNLFHLYKAADTPDSCRRYVDVSNKF